MAASMTERQAYAAMYAFLDDLFQRTRADDLRALLGSMSLLKDGGTADPALWNEWKAAVEKVLSGDVDLSLRIDVDRD